MNNRHDDPGMALVRHLRARGFTVEEGQQAGEYVVTAHRGSGLPLRPRLSLPADLLAEYLETMNRTPGATPPGTDALSLVEVHLEEELTTADLDGRNRLTVAGVRRGPRGRVEWFAQRDLPAEEARQYPAPPQDLEWRAEPPR